MSNTAFWVDSHCHLGKYFYESFGVEVPEVTEVVSVFEKAGVVAVTSGTSQDTNIEAVQIANKFSSVYAVVGLHPHNVEEYSVNKTIESISDLLNKTGREIVGIGEIGLDYSFGTSEKSRSVQKVAFNKMLEFASKNNLPVVVHCRDAWRDVKNIIIDYQVKGIFHCFTGTYEEARWCIDNGFYLGIGGIVTFPNAKNLREVVKKIGVEYIVLETDSPWLAPQKHRGEVNHPKYVSEIGRFVAGILKLHVERVKEATFRNAVSLFGLSI